MAIANWPDGKNIAELTSIDSLYDPSKKMFSQDQVDTATGTVEVNTVEQLVQALRSSATTILLNPTNGIFAFQTDPIYKEGFSTGLLRNTITIKAGHLTEENGAYVIVDDDDIAIIQGVQITGDYFFSTYFESSYRTNYFSKFWLKDCVHTKTTNSLYTFAGTARANIEDCLLSMHVRNGEHSLGVESAYYTLTNCARYIEFSDMDESTAPSAQSIFQGSTNGCSTIVRNLTLVLSDGDSSATSLIGGNNTNGSWDIEFYKIYTNVSNGTFVGNSTNDVLVNIQNSFVSLKYKDMVVQSGVQPTSWLSNGVVSLTATGVNVYNYSSTDGPDARGYKTIPAKTNVNVKQLSDADCHNYAALNKWGFFVNQATSGD